MSALISPVALGLGTSLSCQDPEVSRADQMAWAESGCEDQLINLLPYTNSSERDKVLMLSIRLLSARGRHPRGAMRDPLLWDQVEHGILASASDPLRAAFQYSGVLSGEILGHLKNLEMQVSP